MTTNPYESPRAEVAGSAAGVDRRLTLFSATMYVLLTSGGCCLLGGLLGFGLGVLAPDYYRAVFPRLNGPNFNPVAMGIALGSMQGLFAGVIIGFIILLIYVWYLTRLKRQLG